MPDEQRRRSLRTSFEEVPDLYDRARPTYPESLIDDLVSLAGLGYRARILEIGCGTGKATLALAGRGFRVTCVELGERLAEVARRNLRRFPDVDVVTGDFETWDAPAADFDAVVAFTAFHWIDPEVRYERSAAALRDGGALAVVATRHVLPPDGDPFFAEDGDRRPPRPEDVADLTNEILASGLFDEVAVRRHPWDVVYTADDYVAVLDTYSEQRALDETARDELYARMRRRIEGTPGGTVRKTYLATLNVARRSSKRRRRSARKS